MTRPAVVQVKPGVLFTVIAPGGFRLLGAIDRAARVSGLSLTITSACDGEHSGPDDPHHRGEAYDVRSHGFVDPKSKMLILGLILDACRYEDEPTATTLSTIPESLATHAFFGFVEALGTDNEHLHVQVRKGQGYP